MAFPTLDEERVIRWKGAVMTATLDDVTKKIKPEPSAEKLAAVELVRRAREQGLSLTGPDGLLKQLTKTVLTTRASMIAAVGSGTRPPARGPLSAAGRGWPRWCRPSPTWRSSHRPSGTAGSHAAQMPRAPGPVHVQDRVHDLAQLTHRLGQV